MDFFFLLLGTLDKIGTIKRIIFSFLHFLLTIVEEILGEEDFAFLFFDQGFCGRNPCPLVQGEIEIVVKGLHGEYT